MFQLYYKGAVIKGGLFKMLFNIFNYTITVNKKKDISRVIQKIYYQNLENQRAEQRVYLEYKAGITQYL